MPCEMSGPNTHKETTALKFQRVYGHFARSQIGTRRNLITRGVAIAVIY